MITVILKGGLGNILFQYAVGRHVAIKNNTTLRLNLIRYLNKQDFFAKKNNPATSKFRVFRNALPASDL